MHTFDYLQQNYTIWDFCACVFLHILMNFVISCKVFSHHYVIIRPLLNICFSLINFYLCLLWVHVCVCFILQILCNGPGTCVPLCVAGFLLTVSSIPPYTYIMKASGNVLKVYNVIKTYFDKSTTHACIFWYEGHQV